MALVGLVIAVLYKIIVEILAKVVTPTIEIKSKTFSQTSNNFRHNYWN